MGQKSNIITLRKSYKNLNFSNLNKNIFFFGLNFSKAFKQLLLKKRVIVVKDCINIEGNKLFLKLDLFFRTLKIKVYRRKNLIDNDVSKKKLLVNNTKNTLNKLLTYYYSKFKINSVYTQISVLNKFNKHLFKYLAKKLKHFSSVLFKRRLGLFIDFIKLTLFYIQGKVDLNVYCLVLSDIFKFLQKKLHAKFLTFIKTIFLTLINDKKFKNVISGAKFSINGRFKGKTRSSSTFLQLGSVSNQSLNKEIDFAKIHIFTKKMGVFGLKLWVQKNN